MKWINVKNELPRANKKVLVATKKARCVAYLRNDGSWEWLGGFILNTVTHWMELPNFPEIEEIPTI